MKNYTLHFRVTFIEDIKNYFAGDIKYLYFHFSHYDFDFYEAFDYCTAFVNDYYSDHCEIDFIRFEVSDEGF